MVYLVGAGPGDPGLITVKGLECLRRAEVVVYDRLAAPALLAEAPESCERIYVGKASSRHALSQDEINALLVQKAAAGLRVVRLKGGDPYVFGRGGEEADALVSAGLPFEVVPGVTAGVAVPAYAGIPVTHRGVATAVAFITGHEDPTKPDSQLDWGRLATGFATLVFYMGMENLAEISGQLVAHGRAPDTPAAVIRWGTRPEQRTVTGTLADIAGRVAAADLGPPALIVVGDVVRLRARLNWFERRPLFGRQVLVTRTRTQASALVDEVRALGGSVFEYNAISVHDPADWTPVDELIERVDQFDWVVFTSQNGVTRFLGRLFDHHGWDARALGGARLAAVGPATAAELRRYGLTADLVPPEPQAAALPPALLPLLQPGNHVLIVRAEAAAADLAAPLRQAGIGATECIAYRTGPGAGDVDDLQRALANGEIHYATFASSSAVTHLLEAAGGPGALAGVTIAVIGPQTAEAARAAGLPVHVVAAEPSVAALAQAIAAHATAHRNPDGSS